MSGERVFSVARSTTATGGFSAELREQLRALGADLSGAADGEGAGGEVDEWTVAELRERVERLERQWGVVDEADAEADGGGEGEGGDVTGNVAEWTSSVGALAALSAREAARDPASGVGGVSDEYPNVGALATLSARETARERPGAAAPSSSAEEYPSVGALGALDRRERRR